MTMIFKKLMIKFKGEKCRGGKIPKDKLTILLVANMTESDKEVISYWQGKETKVLQKCDVSANYS